MTECIRDRSQQLSSHGELISWSIATIDYTFLQLVSFFLTSKQSQNNFFNSNRIVILTDLKL